jgi:hypothetical protein
VKKADGGPPKKERPFVMETIRLAQDEIEKELRNLEAPQKTMTGAIGTLQEVYSVLEASNITDQDIWEGAVEVYPIIKHFKDKIVTAELYPVNCVNFVFPKRPEFASVPEGNKTYKIDKNLAIYKVVGMISKKLGIENAKKYTLCTTRGFVLNDKETLASYGLGSLLKNWQLKVVLKRVTNLKRIESLKARDIVSDTPTNEQENKDGNQHAAKISSAKKLKEAKLTKRKPTIIAKKSKDSLDDKDAATKKDSTSSVSAPSTSKSLADSRTKKDTKSVISSSKKVSLAPLSKTDMTSASPPVSPRGPVEEEEVVITSGPKRYPVLFVFDESFPVRTQRAMINPALPTVDVLTALCKAHNVKNPDKFALATFKNLILDYKSPMEAYGFGVRFQDWQLQVLPTEKLAKMPNARLIDPKSKFGWMDVEEANFGIDEAKAIILEFESRFQKLKAKDSKGGKKKSKKEEEAEKEKASELEAQLKKVKAELDSAQLERKTLRDQVTQMVDQQKQSRDAQVQEKNKFESLQLERETLLGQLTKLAQVLKQQKEYYEKQVKALEQSLSETTRLKEEAGNKKDKKSTKQDNEQMVQLQVALEKSKFDMESLKNEMTHKSETLNSEISNLKQELQTLQSKLDASNGKKDELENELANLSSKLDNSAREFADLQLQLETDKMKLEEQEKKTAELQAKIDSGEVPPQVLKKLKLQIKKKFEVKFAELSKQTTSLRGEKSQLEDQLLEMRQKTQLLQWEKELADKRLDETNREHEELSSKLRKEISLLDNKLRVEQSMAKSSSDMGSSSGSLLPPPSPPQDEDSMPSTPRDSIEELGTSDSAVSATGGPTPPPPPPPSLTTSVISSSVGSGSISPRSGISSDGLARAAQGLRQAAPVEKPSPAASSGSIVTEILSFAKTSLKSVVKDDKAQERQLTPLELTLQKRFMAMQSFDDDDAEDLDQWSDGESESFDSDDEDVDVEDVSADDMSVDIAEQDDEFFMFLEI